MVAYSLLDISIDPQPGGGAQVRLRFEEPASDVAANEAKGRLALSEPLPDVTEQPVSHGKALTDALFSKQVVRDKFIRALNATLGASTPCPLRIRLRLPTETADLETDVFTLHDLCWETLLDPRDEHEQPLLSRSNVYFARFLPGDEAAGGALSGRVRALVAIANPSKLAGGTIKIGSRQLRPVDVTVERDRARKGLGNLVAAELYDLDGQPGKVSLANLLEELSRGESYQILYLVCHGAILKEKQPPGPYLWLDEVDEEPVPAQRLVDALRDMEAEHRPRLVVLASCQSAGGSSDDKGMLAALGPKLVQEGGILAVVAMQGDVYMRTVEAFMPVFFRELTKDGQVERAMAAARSYLHTVPREEAARKQWWVPVLYSRLASGQMWHSPKDGISDRWSRTMVELPIGKDVIQKLGRRVQTMRKLAQSKFAELLAERRPPPTAIDPERVRVTVFLPDMRDAVSMGEVCGLYIPPKLYQGIETSSAERQIRFRTNEGLTGRVYTEQRPLGARRQTAGADWKRIELEGRNPITDKAFDLTDAQKTVVDNRLNWIVSFPLKASETGETLGVFNIDGLTDVLNDDEMWEMYDALRGEVADFAADLEKLPKCRVTISVSYP